MLLCGELEAYTVYPRSSYSYLPLMCTAAEENGNTHEG